MSNGFTAICLSLASLDGRLSDDWLSDLSLASLDGPLVTGFTGSHLL